MKTRDGLTLPDSFDKKTGTGTVDIDGDVFLNFKIDGNRIIWTGAVKFEYDEGSRDWKTTGEYTAFQASVMARVEGITGIAI